MKLILILMTTFLVQVSGSTFAQRVTLNEKNASLQQVLLKIKQQTGYDILYADNVVSTAGRIDVAVTNATLSQALNSVLDNQKLAYSIGDRTVVIKAKKTSSSIHEQTEKAVQVGISGRIEDENGNALAGATVKVKGRQQATKTDSHGEFTLYDVGEGAVLEISYLGYWTQQVAIGAASYIRVKMESATSNLDEVNVVNTGYQKLPKERVTGSFKVIAGEQLEKAGTSLSQRLIGAVSGLVATIDPSTGAASFQIRGTSTLGANASPLIVIDNFAVNETDFSQINPNDVESVVFLKDAAAASIWGARAANGVIVVTTKSGRRGTPLSLEVSAFTQIANKLDVNYVRGLATSAETVDYERNTFNRFGSATVPNVLRNAAYRRSQAGILLNEHFLGFITEDQLNAGLNMLRGLDNTNQIRQHLLSNPLTNQVNLSISGGTERMTNNMTVLYESNQYDFRGNDNKKTQLNYKTTANIAKWLDFDASVMGQYIMANKNGYTVNDLKSWSPYDMFINSDGSYTDIPAGLYAGGAWYYPLLERFVPTERFPYADWSYNPVVDLGTHDITAQTLNARVQGGLTFKFMKGISLRSSIQYDNFNVFDRGYYNESSYRVRNGINIATSWDQTPDGEITPLLPLGAQLEQGRTQSSGYTWRNQLNIDRSFGDDHDLNVVLGTEATHRINRGFVHPTTYGYNDATLATGGFGNGIGGWYPLQPSYRISTWLNPGGQYAIDGIYNSFSYSTDRFVSLFGNAAYTYKGKYSLSGSLRTDASNLITDDPKYRYQPFWSIGGRWNAQREEFLQSATWLDELSIRATFGYQGNVDRSTSFLPLLDIGSEIDPITGVPTNMISSFGNPSLRWERTAATNLGVDFSLFKRKLFGTIELYNKNSQDLIARVSIPSANGTNVQSLNNGAMVNKGINMEIGTHQTINNAMSWSGSLNFAYNYNKITDFFYATYYYWEVPQNAQLIEGYNLNEVFSVRYAGLNTEGYPAVYAGADGAPVTVSTSPYGLGDPREFLEASGTTVPPYTLGFTNSFRYKDFNLSFIITGRFGAIYRATPFNSPFQQAGPSDRVLPNSRLHYAVNGDGSSYLPMPSNANDPTLYAWSMWSPYMDYLIESANVIRMQELNLSYDVRPEFVNRIGLRRLNLYAQGNNLFTITNNRYNEDPEFREGSLRPMPRFTLGLRVGF